MCFQQEIRSTDRNDGRITATLRPATTPKDGPLPVPEEAMPLRDMAAVGGLVERANEHVDMVSPLWQLTCPLARR